ncbi:MAG: protoporphyrinogen oxidase [Microthrixaceae bacterium]
MRRLVVVGAGITGLAAAWEATQHPRVEVVVLDAADRVGGKIRTSRLSGEPVAAGAVSDGAVSEMVIDEGADAFLARVPDAVELCRELGLEDELTQPATGRAQVFHDGALRFLPTDTVLGVPLDLDALAGSGLVSADGVERARQELERDWTAPSEDVAIGAFLAERYGRELVDHVVGPLIGGINAGDVDRLSLRAVTPQLADAAADGGSLTAALRRRVPATPPTTPVFHALLGGTERLIDALVQELLARGVTIETGVRATGVAASRGAVHLDVSRADGSPQTLTADGLLLCTPAFAGAAVLGGLSPAAAAALGRFSYSSPALTTLAYRREDVPAGELASGFLVPRDEHLLLTAASVGSSKWAHWDDGRHVVLRVSAGHAGDERGLELDDEELLAGLRADLATTLGVTAEPLAARVTRYPRGFTQYEVGHLDRVAQIEATLDADCPRLRVAGASYRGVGIPACVRQGREATRAVLAG